MGVAGSAGKTTTRVAVAAALDAIAPGSVHFARGNLNNLIGVPLTILRAPLAASAWVLELGMNHLGEIWRLQEISRPSVRIITNVGAAHLEGELRGRLAGFDIADYFVNVSADELMSVLI